jgi:energy-coupling factor transporter ATP-binding protein EcfA2
MNKKFDITYFAKTNSRGQETEFGIKDEDRLRHVYLIGKTGMGKSTIFENMAVQDINKGNGLCFIDPHGSAIDTFLEYIPEHRIKDVVYFCPFDVKNPIAFNVMDNSELDENTRFLVAQGLLAAFKKVFGEESFSDRMVHILNNTLLALLEYPGSTLLSVTRMLTDTGYENAVVANITDPSVKDF